MTLGPANTAALRALHCRGATIIVALEGGAAIIFIVVALRAMLLGAEQLAQLFIGGQWGLEPLGPRCSQKLAGK